MPRSQRRYMRQGIDQGCALVIGVKALLQNEVGQGPVLAVVAGRAQKGLLEPSLKDGQQRRPPVRGQGPRGADNRLVEGLGSPQKIQVHEPDALHFAHETLVSVINPDVAGHRPDGRVLLQRGHQMAQGLGFDDAVRIHGHQDLAPGGPETGVQGLLFAAVFLKADGPDQVREPRPHLVDVIPGVVSGTVVHADDFQLLPGIIGPNHRVQGHPHHLPFVVCRYDDGESGQGSIAQGIWAVAGPKDGAQALQEQHQQSVTGPQRRKKSSVSPALK